MQSWLRILAYSQIVGGLCCVAASVQPKGLDQDTFWFTLVLFPLMAGGLAVIAGFLLLFQEPRALQLSLALQAAQVIAFGSGWRYVFHTGQWVLLLVNSAGAGLVPGMGGHAIATAHPGDGGLQSLGFDFQVTLGLFGKSRATPSWSLGINLVALFFALHLWRTIQGKATIPAAPTLPAA